MLGGADDRAVGMAHGDTNGRAAAHQDAFEQRLAAEVSARHLLRLSCRWRTYRRHVATRLDQSRADRSRRFWKRSTWPAVSMIVCLPVKNGWQLAHTSTRSSGRVDPSVHSVPPERQGT